MISVIQWESVQARDHSCHPRVLSISGIIYNDDDDNVHTSETDSLDRTVMTNELSNALVRL